MTEKDILKITAKKVLTYSTDLLLRLYGVCLLILFIDFRLLASGSDDVQVYIWDPFLYKTHGIVRTGHQGNIFTVKVN